MVAHTSNSSTLEAEAGGSLWVQVQFGLHSQFQDNQDYIVKPNLKINKQIKRPPTNQFYFLLLCSFVNKRCRDVYLQCIYIYTYLLCVHVHRVCMCTVCVHCVCLVHYVRVHVCVYCVCTMCVYCVHVHCVCVPGVCPVSICNMCVYCVYVYGVCVWCVCACALCALHRVCAMCMCTMCVHHVCVCTVCMSTVCALYVRVHCVRMHCVCVHRVCMCICAVSHVEVWGQLAEISSLLSPCWSGELYSKSSGLAASAFPHWAIFAAGTVIYSLFSVCCMLSCLGKPPSSQLGRTDFYFLRTFTSSLCHFCDLFCHEGWN